MTPILFNSGMVRAILAGRKTMTRRVIKARISAQQPYWPGDILYVRETWRVQSATEPAMVGMPTLGCGLCHLSESKSQTEDDKTVGMISIGVGTYTFGCRQTDGSGKVVCKTPAKWEYDPNGSAVAIVPLDPETMEQSGEAELFGDWQAGEYLARVLEHIHPNRKINVPNLEAMIKQAAMDGLDLCDYCENCYMCRDCIVKSWKENTSDN